MNKSSVPVSAMQQTRTARTECDRLRIPYVLVRITKVQGRKVVKGFPPAGSNYLDWDYDKCMEWNADKPPSHQHINVILRNQPYMVVDEDMSEGHDERFAHQPFTESYSGKRHYWMMVADDDPRRHTTQKGEGTDFVYNNIFESGVKPISFDFDEVDVFDWETYLPPPPPPPPVPDKKANVPANIKYQRTDYDELLEIVDGEQFIAPMDAWQRFMASCYAAGIDKECVRARCQAADAGNYEQGHFERLWAILSKNGSRCSPGSLVYAAQQSNPEATRKWKFKHVGIKGFSLLPEDDDGSDEKKVPNTITNTALAKVYMILRKGDLVRDQSKRLRIVDNETALWCGDEEARSHVMCDIYERLTELVEAKLEEELTVGQTKALWRLLNNLGTERLQSEIYNLIQQLSVTREYKLPEVPIDKTHDLILRIPFQNGILDFKTWKLQPITPTDYVSVTLPYDYQEVDPKIIQETSTILDQIFRDEPVREWFKGQMALACTGSHHPDMCFLLGEGGNNGKSSATKYMLAPALGPFALDSGDLFAKNTTDSEYNKIYIDFLQQPIRMSFSDETTEGGFSGKRLKNFIDGGKSKCTQLYTHIKAAGANLATHFQSSNNAIPLEGLDGGVVRRMRQINMTSRFVKKEQDVDEENGYYLMDARYEKDHTNPFQLHDDYKMSIWYVLRNYIQEYANNGTLPSVEPLEANFARETAEQIPCFEYLTRRYQVIPVRSRMTEDSLKTGDLYTAAIEKIRDPITDRFKTRCGCHVKSKTQFNNWLRIVFGGDVINKKTWRVYLSERPEWRSAEPLWED
jgi:hypothetical protein